MGIKTNRQRIIFLGLSLLLLGVAVLGRPFPTTARPVQTPPGAPENDAFGRTLSTPAYDSGWVDVGAHETQWKNIELIHNLGGDLHSYLVDLQCWDNSGIATYNCVDDNFLPNAYWHHLTNTNIRVKVIAGTRPDSIRLRIYRMDPAYDSDWTYIGYRVDPLSLDFTHNLGSVEGIVDLTCFSTMNGFFNCTGLETGSFARAALWHSLDTNNIRVKVRGGDQPSEVRIRIFDKGMSFSTLHYNLDETDPINAFISLPFENIPEINLIQIRCDDPSGEGGLNECTDQGFEINASWKNLYGFCMTIRFLPDSDRQVLMKYWANFPRFLPTLLGP